MTPLGCGWSGAMTSLFLELEAEAAKLRPLPQTRASPGAPQDARAGDALVASARFGLGAGCGV